MQCEEVSSGPEHRDQCDNSSSAGWQAQRIPDLLQSFKRKL